MSDQATADIDLPADDVTDETPHAEPATSVALAPRERRSEVIRPLDPEQLVESFEQYQQLLPRLLTHADYQEAGRGKRFVKKSGWRKIATAFDLDVQIVRSAVERDEAGQPLRAEVWARAIAPSGRSMDGDGYCSIDEERFSGPRGNKSKLENDLRATATTRAMNRAISGLVGMGEVSAEEISSSGSDIPNDLAPPWAGDATEARKGQLLASLERIVGNREQAEGICAAMRNSLGCIPEVTVGLVNGIVQTLDANAAAEGHEPGQAQ